ncbi:hypothetical protein DPMN_138150 [Dreissena polymorpha]|uniref:Uncharacterized protein n=1 Tax=Dreissena polymorpha TaxID=45954 RepID=A0A9D4G6K9_DREPO|nr:hypothetical protein DPMN_138150 [Dreissena polymorpha]
MGGRPQSHCGVHKTNSWEADHKHIVEFTRQTHGWQTTSTLWSSQDKLMGGRPQAHCGVHKTNSWVADHKHIVEFTRQTHGLQTIITLWSSQDKLMGVMNISAACMGIVRSTGGHLTLTQPSIFCG